MHCTKLSVCTTLVQSKVAQTFPIEVSVKTVPLPKSPCSPMATLEDKYICIYLVSLYCGEFVESLASYTNYITEQGIFSYIMLTIPKYSGFI